MKISHLKVLKASFTILIAITLLTLNANVSIAGCAPAARAPNITWQDTYGNDDLWVHDMIQTSDGNFALTGQRQYFNEQMDMGTEIMLMKVTANGTKLSNWLIDYGFGNLYSGEYIRQLPDGSFIILGSGYKRDTGKSFYLMLKVNSNGDKVFEKTYDSPAGMMMCTCTGATLANDGGYLLAGYCEDQNSKSYVYLVKINVRGIKQWEKIISDPAGLGPYSAMANSVITVPGGYALTGEALDSSGVNGSVFFLKVDTKGNPVIKKAFGALYPDTTGTNYHGFCIKHTNDCGYIICGLTYAISNPLYENGASFLLKLDRNGCYKWLKTYGWDIGSVAQGVCQTKDGGYIVTGGNNATVFSSVNAYIMKTDPCGNARWTIDFVDGQYATSNGDLIMQLPDKGYVMAGFAVPGGYAEVLMARLSPEGC